MLVYKHILNVAKIMTVTLFLLLYYPSDPMADFYELFLYCIFVFN